MIIHILKEISQRLSINDGRNNYRLSEKELDFLCGLCAFIKALWTSVVVDEGPYITGA